MKHFFAFLLTSFVAVGCTLTEKVVFNPKMGGSMSYRLDASEFMNFAKSMDSTGSVNYNLSDSLGDLKFLAQALNSVKGISNAELKGEGDVITISFDFLNPEALNAAHREMGKSGELTGLATDTYDKITQKGKKELTYRTLPLGTSANDSAYASMGMMLTHKLDVTFPKKIKSVSESAVQVEGNKITWTSTAEDNGAKMAFDGLKIKF
jgi:hypothetical protein